MFRSSLHLAVSAVTGVPAVPTSALTTPVPTFEPDGQVESSGVVMLFSVEAAHFFLTKPALPLRPSKWILYVLTGDERLPLASPTVYLKMTPTGFGFFFVPPLAILPDTV